MKIVESQKTTHEIINIHYDTQSEQVQEKWIDIHRNEDGEVVSVSIGNKEITAFELQILNFLKRKGKI